MSWFDTVKDIFTKTEVTEETFEYESIDSYLAKQAAREAARKTLDGAEEKDDSHDPTVFSADIRVDQHRDGQTDQHEAQWNQQGHCVDIPCHTLSSPLSAASLRSIGAT